MSKLTGICLLLAATLLSKTSFAWTTTTTRNNVATFRRTTSILHASEEGVEAMSVENLVNHEEEGSKMAKSIVKWLDKEVRCI
jgi:hypothetical protein